MKRLCPSACSPFLLSVVVVAAAASMSHAQLGPIFTGTGAVNWSMAGASTAAPLSADGALYWNPATMSGLCRSELDASAELIWPETKVSSQTAAGAFGPGLPPIGLAGQSDSDSGATPAPSIGLVYRPDGSDLTYGLGIYGLAGFGTNYAGSTTNVPLTPPPPRGFGVGPVYSEFELIQIHPAIAYQLTDRLSIGGGPAVDLAILQVKPGLFAAPDNASGNGFATYPDATHSETTWGASFDVGLYYKGDGWGFGASYKSPQWLDSFRYNSADQVGNARQLKLDLDLPQIISVGVAYTALERWVFDVDVRYVDFTDAKFMGDSGFTPTGAIRGLGWRSIWAVAAGAQYQWTDALAVRFGYSWNQNPVPASQSFINIASPLLLENVIYAGASWNITPDFALNIGYAHAFENSITGPVVTPAGAVPGTSVTNSTQADLFMLGATVKFGGPGRGAGPQAGTADLRIE